MRMKIIRFRVNGEERQLEVEVWQTLLEVLRDRLGLIGVKSGCGTGGCGACTVLLNGKPVNSCITLAVEIDGSEVTTVEGLMRNGELHPLQRAFVENDALQCGFCTPGMIMAAKALLDEKPNPNVEEIIEALSGNLCRCGCYPRIIKAILQASKEITLKEVQ